MYHYKFNQISAMFNHNKPLKVLNKNIQSLLYNECIYRKLYLGKTYNFRIYSYRESYVSRKKSSLSALNNWDSVLLLLYFLSLWIY